MRKIISMVLVTFCFMSTANAHEEDRVATLEREVQNLAQIVALLESALSETPPAESAGDAAGSLANWRTLVTGMSEAQVKSILGEPKKVISGGPVAGWSYEDHGSVEFYEGKLHSWSEPRTN